MSAGPNPIWIAVRRVAMATLLACLMISRAPYAFALDPALDVSQYAHTSWKIRDGFTKGPISSIVQTPDGYLWLGTHLGLLRFDGVRNVPFPPTDQPLPSNTIFKLLVARDGTLWIATDKGLASWNGGRLTQYPEFAGQWVFALAQVRDGAVWAGTYSTVPTGGKLCAIQNGSVQCYGQDGALGRGVADLYEDNKGNLWAEGENGLWRWTPGPPEFLPVPAVSVHPGSLAEDFGGALLIGTKSGIRRLVDRKSDVHRLPTSVRQFRTLSLLRDRDGGLWIGTSGRGLLHFHQGRTDVFSSSDGLSGDDVDSIFEDREGNVWVATLNGLDRFRDFAVPTFSVKQGLSIPSVVSAALAVRNGNLLFASVGGLNGWVNGHFVIHGKNTARAQQGDNAESSLFQDARGRVWAVTQREFGYLEDYQFIALSGIPGGVVRSIVEDGDGSLWIANQNSGLFHLRESEVVEQIPWDKIGHKDFAAALAVDPLHRGLWLGFFQGGLVYFKDGKVLATYGSSDGLGNGRVNDLRIDQDGTLWAAAEGGLSRLKNNRIATLNSRNGLPCDTVHWLMEDDDHSFWLNTTCGVVRVAKAELDAWTAAVDEGKDETGKIQFTFFDISDGVRTSPYPIGYSPQVAKSTDGKLWFPSFVGGVSVIDPRHLHFNPLPPPVYIEQVTADRKIYNAASAAKGLPSSVRDLQIDYTALSFAAPDKVQFRYKLEGYDRDWQDAGNRRQAFYTNLPPRNYRFRMMAANNSGVWNEAGTFLDFSIAPAYYQTDWFRLSIVVAVLGSLAALYRLRQRQVARQFNIRLEERVRERTRIARELHDTLLQSFQGVLLRFHTVTYQLPDGADEARNTLESVIEQARQAITEGRDAVQGLRSLPVINDLAAAISTLGEELAADQGVENRPDFSVHVEGTPRALAPFPRDETYRIAIEAVRNAFRHGNAKRIEVEIHYGQRQLRLRVRDNGKGIDPKVLSGQARQGHYGLTGMQERAKSMGGTLAVWSEIDSGTEAELNIPASTAYAKSSAANRSMSWGKGT